MNNRYFDYISSIDPVRIAKAVEAKAEKVINEAAVDVSNSITQKEPWLKGWITPKVIIGTVAAIIVAAAVGFYAWRWYTKPVSANDDRLWPVITEGGETNIYGTSEVEDAAGAKKTPTTRKINTVKKKDLPQEEQDKFPVLSMTDAERRVWENNRREAAAANNNGAPGAPVIEAPPETELATTAVVPWSRGDTDVRVYLRPTGDFQTTLERKPEPFWGIDMYHLEVDAGYGLVGRDRASVGIEWMPIRMGDFHIGAEVRGASEQDGALNGSGLIKFKWEPFREKYR